MFQFKFNVLNNKDEDSGEKNIIQWHKAKEVIPQKNDITIEDNLNNIKTFECNNVKLKYISSDDVIVNLINSDDNHLSSVLKAETNHSDLVPGEYEGGLKIWECTSDLINHLSSENLTFSNKKVLDLGCGAGMLGIYALLQGSLVDFQDYNSEVIEHKTIPNVLLNSNNNKLQNCKFFAGDWKSFMDLISTKYDYIFTSETIYNPDNYRKLLDVFNQLLEPNGAIYLAAKTYYFGVGGGIRQFEELLNKGGILNSTLCWKNTSGVQREILRIFKK